MMTPLVPLLLWPLIALAGLLPNGRSLVNGALLNGAVQNGIYADLGRGALTGEHVVSVGLAEAVGPEGGFGPIFAYLVECALPETAKVTVGEGARAAVFRGALGLAPEWADGPCDEACQEWVSACLLARTNAYGLAVSIYLDAPHPAIRAGALEGRSGYSVREGAYFGNIFRDPEWQYSCRGDGRDPLALTWRACARPGGRCGFAHAGACGAVDGETGEVVAEPACEVDADGLYSRCRSRPGGRVFERVVTMYLWPTSFGAAPQTVRDDCGAPPGSTPPPASPGAPGTRCLHDHVCAEHLTCDVSLIGQGQCTRACDEAADPEEVCGEGSTCLRGPAFPFCTEACEPGGCGAGRICTGLWLSNGVPDAPGCFPFCTADAHCGVGTYCNPRTGTCGPPLEEGGLEDGAPCSDFALPDGSPPAACRGTCFTYDGNHPERGLCGSLLNRAVADACPDRPASMRPLRPNTSDDLAVCIYRQCNDDGDCIPPLRCVRQPLEPGQCLH